MTGRPGIPSNILKNIPLFSSLSEQELDVISQMAVRKTCPADTLIMSEGDTDYALYVIESGRLKVFLMDETGKEIVLDTKGPGDYFGEMALLDDSPRSASVMALEGASMLVIQGREFREYLSTRPDIAINLLEALSRRIRILNEQVKDLALKDVYTRLVKVFRQLGEKEQGRYVIHQKMTHQDLANRVGSSREMVSRIVTDLIKGGYIKKENNRLIISANLPPRW